ncbi:hypothetical protein JJ691_35440 [Kutzneria sp. CA-103260]|nr:hypothetical protein JJ691_35440 [Kutzneria sp. CA-103260]
MIAAAMLVALASPAAGATVHTVTVSGQVAAPAAYTGAQLASLPQVTEGGVTGVDLEALVERSAPKVPAGHNTQLRVVLTVTASHHRAVRFALGELAPDFGNHPAVLTDHRQLVVPGDRGRSRDLDDVTSVQVAVSDAAAVSTAPGSVRVTGPHRTVTVSAALLARLPRRTVTVAFQSGTGSQTHTESGPELSLVLLAAGVLPTADTAVVAVGSDGYGAAVTIAEERVGGRPLLLSTVEDGTPLAQPRLVTDGDVKGGRYVSGVVLLQA